MKMLGLLLGFCFVIGLSAMAADTPAKKGKLRHVVAFKFKESASKADIKKVDIDCLRTGPIGCFRATKPPSG